MHLKKTKSWKPSSGAHSNGENCRLDSLCCLALSIIICKVKFPEVQSNGDPSSARTLLFSRVTSWPTFFFFNSELTTDEIAANAGQHTNNSALYFCLLRSKQVWTSLLFDKLLLDSDPIVRATSVDPCTHALSKCRQWNWVQGVHWVSCSSRHTYFKMWCLKRVFGRLIQFCSTVLCFPLHTQKATCLWTTVIELVSNYPLFSK